ncbi:MAG: tetratricopeptide repeat protein [Burkholderiales bacterium]|nr:tetratricopeptide repeat protein [Burkholderiales bacterium]
MRRALVAAVTLLAGVAQAGVVQAAATPLPPPTTEPAPPLNSALDAPLIYQLLIGEIELRAGEAGTAYEVILDAARRTRDETLFRRAVDIALGAHAGEQALAATRAWRTAQPQSLDALRAQLQILVAMNRPGDLAEPLRTLLALTPEAELGATLAALPRFLQRLPDARQTVQLVDDAVRPYRDRAATQVPARIALGRAWLAAKDPARALALAREAAVLEPTAPGPALLGMELMQERPEAEALVTGYLTQPAAEVAMRLAYVRALTDAQRYAQAVDQLEIATRQQPDDAAPWLTLGALQLELRHAKEGEAALLHYLQLADRSRAAGEPAAPASAAGEGEGDDEATPPPADRGLVQAWLLLAQAAEQRGDYAGAEKWLTRIDDPQRALEVQTRRASILARQGRIGEARDLIHRVPERRPEDARAKLLAEAGVLREAKRWRDAHDVLATANQRFPDDADLLYEQAMLAEKIDHMDEMEKLLRRVIALKPDNAQAHNALGYSLADRRQRLPEARTLIERALELAPGDPFITDSLGWVEYRMGNRSEALRLLRAAWSARPDTEIGAHLGEVLWTLDQKDEARRVWRDARTRDSGNEVLRETLARLRVEL